MKTVVSPGATNISGGTMATTGKSVALSTPPPVTTNRQLQRLTITLAAGATVPVMVDGDFVFIEDLLWRGETPPSIKLQFDEQPQVEIAQRQTSLRSPTIFAKTAFFNPSATYAITVTFWIGFGYFAQTERPLLVRSFNAISERTRPANVIAYAANQIVGETLAGAFIFADIYRPGSNTAAIRKARISKSTTTTAAADFKLFLCQAGSQLSTSTVDQAVFDQLYTGLTNNLGVIQFPTFVAGGAGSDCAECIVDGIDLLIRTNYFAGGNAIWGYLVAQAAYAPGSAEKFRIELWGEQL